MKLRNFGIYLSPDGEEVIAKAHRGGGYFLYYPYVWESYRGAGGPAEYEVTPRGLVISCSDDRIRWHSGQLTDTGREASPEGRPIIATNFDAFVPDIQALNRLSTGG